MFGKRMLNELNGQLQYEFYSEHIYLAMAAYCHSQDLDGFANFFKVQAEEERFHAMKFFDYINQMDGRAVVMGMEEPENEV